MLNIEGYFTRPEIHEYAVISPEEVPFSPAVSAACAANACGRYGTCWTCPPGVGELSAWEERVKSYRTAVVFTCRYPLEDSFDLEGMMEGQHRTKAVLAAITAALRGDGVDYLALGCEGCGICPTCTYPDAPCRHPELATVSVEATGVHVVELARRAGVRYHNGPNTVTYFCLVLFGGDV